MQVEFIQSFLSVPECARASSKPEALGHVHVSVKVKSFRLDVVSRYWGVVAYLLRDESERVFYQFVGFAEDWVKGFFEPLLLH